MPTIAFLPYGIRLEVPRGTSVLAAADEAAESLPDDFFVGELCEGRHECGNCCVEVVEGSQGLSPATDSEHRLLRKLGYQVDGPRPHGAGGSIVRSACTARIQGDVVVRIIAPVEHPEADGNAQMQAHP
jgi:uncharacterized 2Fe-2S/4Fe-4S cluster protein (DUF4445 family)